MKQYPPSAHLTAAVAQFQRDVERLATAIARAAIDAELVRRRERAAGQRARAVPPRRAAAPRPTARASRPRATKQTARRRPRATTKPSRRTAATKPRTNVAPEPSAAPAYPLELLAAPPPTREPATAPEPAMSIAAPTRPPNAEAPRPHAADTAPMAAPSSSPPAQPSRGGPYDTWTREAVLDELARWVVSGTKVDAWFLKRYGKPGLFGAAVRIFERLEAALLQARLHAAKLSIKRPAQQAGAADALAPSAR